MSQVLSFPGLGIELNIDRVAFTLPEFLGSRPIYWYGIIIALGFLLALSYILSRSKAFGLDTDRVFDVVFTAIVLGIIGARLYYVAFSWENFRGDLLSIFKTWEGGLAIYGGLIFGTLGVIVASKVRKVRLIPMMDLAVGGVFIGQAVGRWGNFFNIEAFGGNTTLPWGMTSPVITSYLTGQQELLAANGMIVDPHLPVHPTFFYESLWCLIGFLIIAIWTSKRRYDGQLTLFYFAWYGLGRFFIEGLRTDSLMLGDIRISQLVALLCFVGATIASLLIRYRIRREQDPEFMQLYVQSEEAQQILAGTFYLDPKKSRSSKDSTTSSPEESQGSEEETSLEDTTKDTEEETKDERPSEL